MLEYTIVLFIGGIVGFFLSFLIFRNKYSADNYVLRELYSPISLIEAPVFSTDLESAEMIKYATNAFLATKISFINEMSSIDRNSLRVAISESLIEPNLPKPIIINESIEVASCLGSDSSGSLINGILVTLLL